MLHGVKQVPIGRRGQFSKLAAVVRLRRALIFALAATGFAGPAAAEPCAPWPGEPRPLPTRDDADPARARWAELRATELMARARMLEAGDPVAAHRLWRRVRCLEGDGPALRAALARTQPVSVARVALVPEPPPARRAPQPAPRPAARAKPKPDPEAAARAAAAKAAARQAERTRLLRGIDARLDALEKQVSAARFPEALDEAGDTRVRLEEMRWEDDLRERWVRLEVAEVTARIALGQNDEARAAAARALARNPELELDPSRYSPKVRRVFDAVRGDRRAAR